MSDIALYKTYLRDYLEQHHNLNNPKKFFTCLNPNHSDNNPSMIYTDKYNICKCFSCGVSYDIFDIIGLDYNLNSFREQYSKLQELYLDKIPIKNDYYEVKDTKVYDYTNYYQKCSKDSFKTNYLINRGITNELIKKYNIGYDIDRNLIVFPINKNCYFARSTVDNRKLKSRGKSDIWNKKYLYEENSLIYVTEGIIDALSLEVIDNDIKTISINGVGNIKSLTHEIKESNFKGNIAIVFDNDSAGKKASKDLKEELDKLNIKSVSITLVSNFDEHIKDINDALIYNKEKLINNYEYISGAIKSAILREKEGDSIER